jgi:predicted metal-binding membrane protein
MQHRLVAGKLQTRAIFVIAGAWLLLVALTLTGNGGVIRHDRLLQGGPPLWLTAMVFVGGWQVMVWAMMAPASLHALGGASVRFIAGYVAAWTAFGLSIFLADAGLHYAVAHWTWPAEHAWLIPGATLVVCGAYQLSDQKSRSLAACLKPPASGVRHGVDCVGSSGGLMLLSFALAASSLAAMAAITLAMVYEVSPWGRAGVKLLGYVLVAAGVGAIALAV